MSVIKKADFVDSIEDALQYISYYHPKDFIDAMEKAYNTEQSSAAKDAMAQIAAKGGKNSLIISDKAAYIVDIANKKVVTAVDKESLSENVFTKIDSTLFIK